MSELAQILLLALLGSVLALIGGVIFLFNDRLSETLEKHSVPFAAGVLLTVSLLGLLPEAVHLMGDNAYLIVLLSFVSAYLFENFFFKVHHHHHHSGSDKHDHQSAVPLVIIGDTIHNLVDGVAIASGFLVNPGLGLITAISTFLHEVPHEISDFGILLKTGWEKRDILLVNVLSASTTIVGALAVVFLLQEPGQVGVLLAISSGLFLYLGASDFLPHMGDGKRPLVATTTFVLGILAMVLTLNAVPHSHNEDSHDEQPHEEDLLREEIMEESQQEIHK